MENWIKIVTIIMEDSYFLFSFVERCTLSILAFNFQTTRNTIKLMNHFLIIIKFSISKIYHWLWKMERRKNLNSCNLEMLQRKRGPFSKGDNLFTHFGYIIFLHSHIHFIIESLLNAPLKSQNSQNKAQKNRNFTSLILHTTNFIMNLHIYKDIVI